MFEYGPSQYLRVLISKMFKKCKYMCHFYKDVANKQKGSSCSDEFYYYGQHNHYLEPFLRVKNHFSKTDAI